MTAKRTKVDQIGKLVALVIGAIEYVVSLVRPRKRLDSTAMPLNVGSRFGQYDVTALIGEAGLGAASTCLTRLEMRMGCCVEG